MAVVLLPVIRMRHAFQFQALEGVLLLDGIESGSVRYDRWARDSPSF